MQGDLFASAGLAASVKVTLNPTDFEKLGLDAGTTPEAVEQGETQTGSA